MYYDRIEQKATLFTFDKLNTDKSWKVECCGFWDLILKCLPVDWHSESPFKITQTSYIKQVSNIVGIFRKGILLVRSVIQ